MNTDNIRSLENVRKVRQIDWHPGAHVKSAEAEVNEALGLGWQLLAVQVRTERPIYVLGWTSNEEPPLTAYQKTLKEYAPKIL